MQYGHAYVKEAEMALCMQGLFTDLGQLSDEWFDHCQEGGPVSADLERRISLVVNWYDRMRRAEYVIYERGDLASLPMAAEQEPTK